MKLDFFARAFRFLFGPRGFRPNWSELDACRSSLREHMALLKTFNYEDTSRPEGFEHEYTRYLVKVIVGDGYGARQEQVEIEGRGLTFIDAITRGTESLGVGIYRLCEVTRIG